MSATSDTIGPMNAVFAVLVGFVVINVIWSYLPLTGGKTLSESTLDFVGLA